MSPTHINIHKLYRNTPLKKFLAPSWKIGNSQQISTKKFQSPLNPLILEFPVSNPFFPNLVLKPSTTL